MFDQMAVPVRYAFWSRQCQPMGRGKDGHKTLLKSNFPEHILSLPWDLLPGVVVFS
jgi:hypothetical protein